jgi:hypothetical protein
MLIKTKSTKAIKLNEVITKLQNAIEAALEEVEDASHTLTNEEIGDLYASYCPIENTIRISNINGLVEFQGGWDVSFEDLAKELWSNTEDSKESMMIVAGIRKMADLIEDWQKQYSPTE